MGKRTWLVAGGVLIALVLMSSLRKPAPERGIDEPSSGNDLARSTPSVGGVVTPIGDGVDDETHPPVTALKESEMTPFDRMLESPELVTEALALRRRWERETAVVLREVSEAASTGGAGSLVLHLPALGDGAKSELSALVVGHAREFGLTMSGEELDSLAKKFGWPQKSRVLLGMAKEDGSDFVVVLDDAGPDAVRIDAETGTTSFSSQDMSFSSKIDPSSYGHLLGVQELD